MNLNYGVIGRCKSRVRWHSAPGLTETVVCFAWQAEGQLRLMFQDEARFGRVSDIPMWVPSTYTTIMPGNGHPGICLCLCCCLCRYGELDILILPQINNHCIQIFLDEVASRHRNDRIILALDGAGGHRSYSLKLPHNLRLLIAATLLTRTQSCEESLG